VCPDNQSPPSIYCWQLGEDDCPVALQQQQSSLSRTQLRAASLANPCNLPELQVSSVSYFRLSFWLWGLLKVFYCATQQAIASPDAQCHCHFHSYRHGLVAMITCMSRACSPSCSWLPEAFIFRQTFSSAAIVHALTAALHFDLRP